MTRFTRTLLIAGFTVGTMLASVADLRACGGGSYRPRYSSYSRPSYYQPVYRPQPVYQPAPQPVQQPIPQPVQQPATQPQPAAAAPTAPQTAPATQTQAPAATGNDAQMSALQALAEMTGQTQPQTPTAQTPARPQTPGIAGNWTSRLSNGAVVQLSLQADGTFNWRATNKAGQVSTFQGSYTTASGSLTLIRSNDNRKLEGTMTQSGANSFNFKLAGAKDNGLDFVRS